MGHKPISSKGTNSNYPEKSFVLKENSCSGESKGQSSPKEPRNKRSRSKKTSTLAKENLATRLLNNVHSCCSWLYFLYLESETKVEGCSGEMSALTMTRTQAMKCWFGKQKEAWRRVKDRANQVVTEHFIPGHCSSN